MQLFARNNVCMGGEKKFPNTTSFLAIGRINILLCIAGTWKSTRTDDETGNAGSDGTR